MSKTSSPLSKWLARISIVHSEYDFGPLKEYRNEEGRLHRDNAPAYVSPTKVTYYQNGRKHGLDVGIFGTIAYYYEGIAVPKRFIDAPETLNLDSIITNPNTEVRYVGLKVYGYDRMEKEGRLKKINEDEKGTLYLFKYNDGKTDLNTEIGLAKVLNSSAEPDGTYKTYFLQVPPDMTTCKEAIAWTFRMNVDDYFPEQES